MPYVSKEQLTAAREVDLLTYLRCSSRRSWCISVAAPTSPAPMTL